MWIPFRSSSRLRRPPPRTVAFWWIFAAATIENAAFAGSSTILPEDLTTRFGSQGWVIGAIAASGPLATLVVQPWAGAFADRRGHRTTGIVGGCAAVLGALLMLAGGSQWLVALSRVLMGSGGAALNTAATAWVVAFTPRGRQGRALSIYGLSVWIGMALGPVVCSSAYQNGGSLGLWLCVASLAALSLLCYHLCFRVAPREPKLPASDGQGASRLSWVSLLGAIARPGGAAAAAWAAEAVVMTYTIVHLTGHGMAPAGVWGASSVFPIFAVSVIVSRIGLARAVDRHRPAVLACASLATVACGCLLLGSAASFAVAAVAMTVLGFGFASLYPTLTMLAAEALPPHSRGAGLGLFQAATSLGTAVGQFGGGVSGGLFGTTSAYVGAGALQAVGVMLLLVRPGPKGRRYPERPVDGVTGT
ncbi:MFS transporter [Streptomyces shenzhenensis]|uniref:MFS transporter n=1 Tax=Streptomyces shenzhenensis TaxID=943815 RepID=UPI0033EA9EEF